MAEKWAYAFLSASGKVSIVKTQIDKIIVTPDGSNASYVDLYDGESANDPQVARLRVPTTQSVVFDFGEDFVLGRGVYLAFEANLSKVTVKWKPVE